MSYLPGDIVGRRKGLVMHKGLVLDDGRVLHNLPLRGEHVSSISEFARGHRISVTARSREQRQAALRNAASRNAGGVDGGRYRLFSNNCEHTVYGIADGRPRSPQLHAWLLGLGAAGITLALTRHPGWAGAVATGVATGVERWLRARS